MSNDFTIQEVVENINIDEITDQINFTGSDDFSIVVDPDTQQINVSISDNENVQIIDHDEILNFQFQEVIQIISNTGTTPNNPVTITPQQRLIEFIDDENILVGYAEEGELTSSNTWKVIKVERGYLLDPVCIDDNTAFDRSWDLRDTYF